MPGGYFWGANFLKLRHGEVVRRICLQRRQEMYACTMKPGADFARGCVLPVIAHSFLATHPHPGIRQLLRADMVMRTLLANRARDFRASYSTSLNEVKGVKRAPRLQYLGALPLNQL
jgi:hypothetical protein